MQPCDQHVTKSCRQRRRPYRSFGDAIVRVNSCLQVVMHVLFVHQNFPAQFRYIAPRLVQDLGWRCTFVTERDNDRDKGSLPGVDKMIYETARRRDAGDSHLARHFENTVAEAYGVYAALREKKEIKPDLIVAHTGFGSSIFLPLLYDAPIINFMEYFYRPVGQDLGYRPEVPRTEIQVLRARRKMRWCCSTWPTAIELGRPPITSEISSRKSSITRLKSSSTALTRASTAELRNPRGSSMT